MVAMPHVILPSTNPTGFPAEKAANAKFFLLLGFPYAAPRIPPAGGTTMAQLMPKTPSTTSIQKGFFEKPTSRTKTAKEPMPARYMNLRPSRSAIWPAASWKAPAERVVAAAIHEISACVMERSRPMDAVTMDEAPTRKVVVDMAMVDCATNETSCRVLEKQAGRWPSPPLPPPGITSSSPPLSAVRDAWVGGVEPG